MSNRKKRFSFENGFITIAINTAVVVHVKKTIIYNQTLRLSKFVRMKRRIVQWFPTAVQDLICSNLICAKLYPLERKRGSHKCCNSRCLVCNNIEETDSHKYRDDESFKINHRLCCNDKCLVYPLTC